MATIKEKFNGLRQSCHDTTWEYECTYLTSGTCAISDFPPTFVWQSKGLANPYAVLVGFSDTVQLGPDRFEVTMKYTTDPFGHRQKKQKKDPPVNPLDRPVVQRWSTGYIERMEDHDLSSPSKLFTASNGEPYEGGLAIRHPYLVKTYTRNEATFNETTALATIWHMDSTHKLLCGKFDGSEAFTENDVEYVQVTYEFWKLPAAGSLTWDKVMLDCGSYSTDTTGFARIYPTDKDGTKSIIPGSVVLDGTGHLGDKDSPHWNTFLVHLVADFSALNLPNL